MGGREGGVPVHGRVEGGRRPGQHQQQAGAGVPPHLAPGTGRQRRPLDRPQRHEQAGRLRLVRRVTGGFRQLEGRGTEPRPVHGGLHHDRGEHRYREISSVMKYSVSFRWARRASGTTTPVRSLPRQFARRKDTTTRPRPPPPLPSCPAPPTGWSSTNAATTSPRTPRLSLGIQPSCRAKGE